MHSRIHFSLTLIASLIFTLATTATAFGGVVVPFTEHFTTDHANWRDNGGVNNLTWNPAGGPDGSPYASTTFNFANSGPADVPPLFRAQDEYNSSNNAFVGDWLAAGVTEFIFDVRHTAPVPINFYARFAGPNNFPGATAIVFAPILPNTWTQVHVAINAANPAFIFEGPSTFASVFSNVGHVQIGLDVPDPLAGVNQPFTFDLDRVTIIPAPAPAGLLLALGLGTLTARRRR